MDCTKHQDVCGKYDVSGYPTFRYFNYGKNDFKYNGGRTVSEYLSHLIRMKLNLIKNKSLDRLDIKNLIRHQLVS